MPHHSQLEWRNAGQQLMRWVFGAAFSAYLLLFIWEDLEPGVVSLNLPLSNVLWVAVISGALSIWLDRAKTTVPVKWTRRDWWWLAAIALGAGIITGLRIKNLGSIGWVIGGITTIIVFLLGRMLSAEDGRDEPVE